jgi:DNA polymerase III gamma/tau subunit
MLICHNVTRAIAVPSLDMSQSMSEFESTRAINSAKNLNIPSVNKCWQILLKGQIEIQSTYSIKEATEMILLRVTYAANLPDLKDLIEKSNLIKKKSKLTDTLENNTFSENNKNSNIDTSYDFSTFEKLLAFVKNNKELSLYTILIDQIRMEEYKPYNLKISFVKKEYKDFLNIIKRTLLKLTKKNWQIEIIKEKNKASSITEKIEIETENKKNKLKDNIIVKSILNEFPESEIIEVKNLEDNEKE